MLIAAVPITRNTAQEPNPNASMINDLPTKLTPNLTKRK